MIEILAGLASSSGLGGIIGFLGNAVGRWQENKQAEREMQHELRNRELDLKELEIQHSQELELADKNMELAEREGEVNRELKEADAFTESVANAFKPTGNSKIDAFRAAIRPVVTLYLLAVTSALAIMVLIEVGGIDALPAETLLELATLIINQVLFLTTTATVWWYGSRKQGPLKKYLDR